jgi:hypothetical protein
MCGCVGVCVGGCVYKIEKFRTLSAPKQFPPPLRSNYWSPVLHRHKGQWSETKGNKQQLLLKKREYGNLKISIYFGLWIKVAALMVCPISITISIFRPRPFFKKAGKYTTLKTCRTVKGQQYMPSIQGRLISCSSLVVMDHRQNKPKKAYI